MALFGAPIAHEDHAQRACYAALQLGGRLRRYARELKREQGLSFSVRMGLNSGEVIVGRIGDDLRMDYTAQGHTVGLAARMQELASPDTVYLSQHTAALVSGFFDLEDLGPFNLRGVRKPVRVHQLRGVGRLRTRLDLARARGFSRFVGREDEMKVLESALECAIAGDGQVLAVVAEPGIGKSRLCFEFAERCRARGIAVREAHGVSHGKMIPFLPVLELMRGYFGIREGDEDETTRDKIAGRVVRMAPELADSLPLLFDFFGVPDPKQPAPAISAEARERQLFGIIRRLVHARSQREPALIVIEDLHWLDGASDRFVENLVESVPGTCTLLLLNHRPEYRSGAAPLASELALGPLDAAAIEELLDDILGRDSSLADLGRRIRERTQGNPFFIEELVQSLVESGNLAGRRGSYRLARPVGSLAIAPTLQAVLAARIDRLASREKQVLQNSAVIGRRFPHSILDRVTSLADPELADALHRLLEAGFLHEEALYPETEYAFNHPLTHEVAYSTQLVGRRARIHAAVAEAIEALHADRLEERAALLAHHWERTDQALRAAHWHRRAALHVGANHFAEAARHWYRVRELLDRVPESKETLAIGVEARGQLIVAAGRLGEAADAAGEMFAEAKQLAERSGDVASLVRVLLHYGYFKSISGQLGEAQVLFVEARRLVEETGDADLKAGALYLPIATSVNGACWCRGTPELLDEALAFTEHDRELGLGVLGFPAHPLLRVLRATVLALSGRLDLHVGELERAAQDRGSHPAVKLMASFFRVLLSECMGDPTRALEYARRALELAERMGFGEGYARVSLGRALLANRSWDEAVKVLEGGLSEVRRRHAYLHLVPGFVIGLARAELGRGDARRARAIAQEAARVDAERGLYAAEAQLVLALALMRSAGARSGDAASVALAAARELADACGVRCLDPPLHEARAELARLQGADAKAERELTEARRLYAEIGAHGHAARLA